MSTSNKYVGEERKIALKIADLKRKMNYHRRKYLDLDVKVNNLKFQLETLMKRRLKK